MNRQVAAGSSNEKRKNDFRRSIRGNCNLLKSITWKRTVKAGTSPTAMMRLGGGELMNTIQDRNRFVQPAARILRRILATAVRDYLQAAHPGAAHRSSRAALGLRPAVKRPPNPAHPERLPATRPSRKPVECPAPPERVIWGQLSCSRNTVRAHEANPLVSADSPQSLPSPSAPHLPKSRWGIPPSGKVGVRKVGVRLRLLEAGVTSPEPATEREE